MKKVLIKDNSLCKEENTFDYEMYMQACIKIAKDIKEKYDLSDPNLGFLGIARGGLPLVTTISQLLNFRNISFIQCKMTNSDNPHDYGDFKLLGSYIEANKTNFILFDDILYKGKTSDGVIEYLNSKNIEAKDLYTLVVDESFNNNSKKISYNSGYECKKDSWIHFFWVEDINQLYLKVGEQNEK